MKPSDRFCGLVIVSGLEVLQLAIPRQSIKARAHTSDHCLVDRRCLKRYRRRASR